MATSIKREVGRPTLAQEYIAIYLKKISEKIKKDQVDKKLVATGNSLKSHNILITKDAVGLFASDYYPFIVEGRGPGYPPPKKNILNWLRVKGIKPSGDMTLNTLAYFIRRKIAKSGTQIHRGEREGIDLLEILTKDEGILYRQIGKIATDEITDTLLESFSKSENKIK